MRLRKCSLPCAVRRVLGRPFSDLGRMISFQGPFAPCAVGAAIGRRVAAGAALDLEYDLVRPMGHKRIIAYSVYPLGRPCLVPVGNGVVIMLEDINPEEGDGGPDH